MNSSLEDSLTSLLLEFRTLVHPGQVSVVDKCLVIARAQLSEFCDEAAREWINCRIKFDIAQELEELLPPSNDRIRAKPYAQWNWNRASQEGYLDRMKAVQEPLKSLIGNLDEQVRATGIEMGQSFWSMPLNQGARHGHLVHFDPQPAGYDPPCRSRIFTFNGELKYITKAYEKSQAHFSYDECQIDLLEEYREAFPDEAIVFNNCIAVIRGLPPGDRAAEFRHDEHHKSYCKYFDYFQLLEGLDDDRERDSTICAVQLHKMSCAHYENRRASRSLEWLADYFVRLTVGTMREEQIVAEERLASSAAGDICPAELVELQRVAGLVFKTPEDPD